MLFHSGAWLVSARIPPGYSYGICAALLSPVRGRARRSNSRLSHRPEAPGLDEELLSSRDKRHRPLPNAPTCEQFLSAGPIMDRVDPGKRLETTCSHQG